ncbi:MAG: hypothetical protein AAFV93_18255 [Chloroflexota bacterium]
MVARFICVVFLLTVVSGCAVSQTAIVTKIALLAPFEGQYREIGYEALYAARLAIDDANLQDISLLAIDDGGREETAILRAEAIANDPVIQAVLLIGIHASSESVQLVLSDETTIIVGHWNSRPITDNTVMLANQDLENEINFSGNVNDIVAEQTMIGSEILSLAQVPELLSDTNSIEVISSSQLPDETFRERYLNNAQFVPEPRLIAPLTYDATQIVLQTILNQQLLSEIVYEGMTGTIRFENGYWVDAPMNRFRYINDELIQLP